MIPVIIPASGQGIEDPQVILGLIGTQDHMADGGRQMTQIHPVPKVNARLQYTIAHFGPHGDPAREGTVADGLEIG